MIALTEEMEKEIEDYMDKFEEDLALIVNNKPEPKLLLELFRDIEEKSRPSEKYFYILREMANRKKDLLDTFSKEQRILFEKYIFLKNELEEQLMEQFWTYGYCFGTEISCEVINNHKELIENEK